MHTKGNAEAKSRLQYSSPAGQKHSQFQKHIQSQDCKIFSPAGQKETEQSRDFLGLPRTLLSR